MSAQASLLESPPSAPVPRVHPRMGIDPSQARHLQKSAANRAKRSKESILARSRACSRAGVRLERPTRAMIRAKCAACLDLPSPRSHGYDCLVADCALYSAMPWRGREMATRLKDPVERSGASAPVGKGGSP